MPRNPALTQQMIYGAAVLVLSALYYGLYLNSGFGTTDDGSFAQTCYELFLGRAPEDLSIAYGILWFKIGEGLFHLFGVKYVLVKIMFFTAIVVTNLLIFYTVAVATGSRVYALAVAVIAAAVPAFPATSFYGLCVMLNVAAQMRFACRLSVPSPWDAAIAGAALSLSFLIRPDFGYAFAIPLAILIAAASRGANPGGRLNKSRDLASAAAAGFIAVQVPFFIAALAGGYAGFVIEQNLTYLKFMIAYVGGGVQSVFAGGNEAVSEVERLLQRPGIAAAFSGDAAAAQLAVLIYAPLAALIGFAAFNARALWRNLREGKFGVPTQVMVVFAAAAALPHYFFYRPDLSHIANFMPGYEVLAAVFVWQLYGAFRATHVTWRRVATGAAIAVLALHVGVYLWVGLQSPATGSIAHGLGRTERFQAANGVDVRVSPRERGDLEHLRGIIERNSKPGDRIVCVPYCPGLAFMTGRRMLFKNFYVDDSFLAYDPEWIPRAIALTREVRPPVVIVVDWAVNGTEASRFGNWAAPYVAALEELARDKSVHPGISIYLL